tara:strand:- start:186 stop:515 length:330 start_codon:yes stop_codon:yes gene_type:complete
LAQEVVVELQVGKVIMEKTLNLKILYLPVEVEVECTTVLQQVAQVDRVEERVTLVPPNLVVRRVLQVKETPVEFTQNQIPTPEAVVVALEVVEVLALQIFMVVVVKLIL